MDYPLAIERSYGYTRVLELMHKAPRPTWGYGGEQHVVLTWDVAHWFKCSARFLNPCSEDFPESFQDRLPRSQPAQFCGVPCLDPVSPSRLALAKVLATINGKATVASA